MDDEARERTGHRLFGGKSPKSLPWNPLPHMDDYLTNLQVDECAGDYIRMVKVGLSHFATFAATEGIKHPAEIERTHILHFQAYLLNRKKPNGEPLATSTRQQILKYVRGWINWLEETGVIDESPWVRIKVGSIRKKPKPLEEDEVVALFDAHRSQAFSIPPFHFHRREVILTLLYGWGLRIHELAALNVTEMDLRLDYVAVRNKGGGSKMEPYGQAIKQVVQRWLIQRGNYAVPGEDALLIDRSGSRLSIAMIRKIVTECGARANVTINPHRLRDTFGTTMLDNDVEVERIMKLMGHTRREQTLAYSRVNDPKLKESHDRVMTPKLTQLLKHKQRPTPLHASALLNSGEPR